MEPPRRWHAALLLLLPPLLLHLPYLDRGFTSEDFPLVRILGQSPPWQELGALFGEPWLGISLVRFYRPVATLIFGAEVALFGSHPTPYVVMHLLVHLLNGLLVWSLLRRAWSPRAALGAALLFLLHPLQPNTVVWAASFATLFGATFFLLSTVLYVRWRERAHPLCLGASLLSFGLALGSYESAVVLPLILLGWDVFVLGIGRRPSTVRRLAPLVAFLSGVVFYLGARRAVLGMVLGGYPALASRLGVFELRVLDLGRSLRLMAFPVYREPAGPSGDVVVLLLLIALPLALALRPDRADGPKPGAVLFALAWAVLCLSPFAFVPAVPANARYWYLAAIGPCVLLASIADSIRPRGRLVPLFALSGLALFYGLELRENLATYHRAGQLAREVATDLQDRLQELPDDLTILVAGAPRFVYNERGVPLAQVYHWGLVDALSPPFGQLRQLVYPLPPDSLDRPLPSFSSHRRPFRLSWQAQARRWAADRAVGAAFPGLALRHPPSGARISASEPVLEAHFVDGAHPRYRLVVLAAGNPLSIERNRQELSAGQADSLALPFSREHLQSMARLYPSPLLWWVEGRGQEGEVLALSRVRLLHVNAPAAGSGGRGLR